MIHKKAVIKTNVKYQNIFLDASYELLDWYYAHAFVGFVIHHQKNYLFNSRDLQQRL